MTIQISTKLQKDRDPTFLDVFSAVAAYMQVLADG